jgi:hypothetical protein
MISMEVDPILAQFLGCLNSPAWLPPMAYRRNSGPYPLVSYVNNSIGAILSGNLEAAALFIGRAIAHMREIEVSPEYERYHRLVASYFAHTIHLIRRADPAIAFHYEIPDVLLSAGPQAGPPDSALEEAQKNLRFWR